jgi:hypothetical protein
MKKLIAWIKKNWFKKPDPPDPILDEINPSDIKWLGVDVGQWKKVYDVKVEIKGDRIYYWQDGSKNWTPQPEAGREDMTANPWIFTNEFDGMWIGATHEWLTKNQQDKDKASVDGEHIKRFEFGGVNWRLWKPTVGRVYGHCTSGLCRGTKRNQSERTRIVLFTWR